jgi:hypothetical protein
MTRTGQRRLNYAIRRCGYSPLPSAPAPTPAMQPLRADFDTERTVHRRSPLDLLAEAAFVTALALSVWLIASVVPEVVRIVKGGL